MKLSRYNYIVKKNREYIIFNTVSGAVLCIDKDFKNRLETNNLSEDERQTLYNMGVIVDDHCDEYQRVIEYNSINKQKQDNKIYTICPTTHCNARCFYCFENDRKHCVMTKEVMDATINFIKKDVEKSNAKHITINWFGGEPLLAQKTIEYITQSLLKDDRLMGKIDLNTNITTNGILINKDTIEKFAEWKVSAVQITLDGFGKTYEKRKNYYNAPNAFFQILDIIKMLCDNKINLSIRLNYDDKNIRSIVKLIKFLDCELSEEQKQYLQTYPAKLECNQSCSICNTKADKNYIKTLKLLNKAKIGKSFKQLNLKYRFAHCLVDSEYNFVIGADGNIYKCNELVDNEEKAIGNVKTGIKDIKTESIDLDQECKECKFFPICQGGCPQRKGDSFAKCQIEKFGIEDILKLYI